jgi:alkylated DNA nucleotide flippase Atl1
MRTRGKRQRVISAVLTGRCNTTYDVAAETGLPARDAGKVVSALLSDGVLRDTGRRMPIGYRNRTMTVFEVVP